MILRFSLLSLYLLAACDGHDAVRVTLPMAVASSDAQIVTTDLGWKVTTTAWKLAVKNFAFTTGDGEIPLATRARRLVIADAYAHPGHGDEGSVAGELAGDYTIYAINPNVAPLGTATLLTGQYEGMNFTFRKETPDGHTAMLVGTASLGTTTVNFLFDVDLPESASIMGAKLLARVTRDSTQTIYFRAQTKSLFSAATLFDGIDFGSGPFLPGHPALGTLAGALAKHDFYAAVAQ